MAQTGVPFGDVAMVRDFLEIEEPVGRPEKEHPKRPVDGFSCKRKEVSGSRLWGWAQERFKKPEEFFRRFFVVNYCPLSFMEASGRNFTPDKLPALERDRLFSLCDQALKEVVLAMNAKHVIGVGAFAMKRAAKALEGMDVEIGQVLHPSPANPKANRDWAGQVDAQLRAQGVEV
jgi:single-strand selective monofunctional uracil DNA glycosylase